MIASSPAVRAAGDGTAPPEEASPSGPVAPPPPAGPQARRVRLLFAALAGLVVCLAAGHHLTAAWHATLLREATLPELERAVQRRPGDGPALALLGTRLAQAHDYAGAAGYFQRAVAAGERNERIWLTWSASLAAAGDAPEAGAVLQLGMKDPRLAPGLRAALERVRALGDRPSPIELARAICPGGPSATAEQLSRGSVLNGIHARWAAGHPERAGVATRERWASERPEDPQAQLLWAEALTENRRFSEAEAVVRGVLAREPKSAPARLALARVLFQEGLPAKAGLEYTALLREQPDNVPALLGLGEVAVEKKLLPIALQMFQRATKNAPDNPDAWVGLGRAYVNERLHWSQAQEAFEKGARLAPDRTDYFADYSMALRARFQFDTAESLLRRRIAADPDDAECRYLLAQLLLERRPGPEREREAEGQLREALHLQPENAATEAALGKLLLARGNPTEAAPMLEASLRHDPYNVAATMSLARAYRRLGRDAEAEKAERQLEKLSDYVQRIAFLEDRIRRDSQNARLHRELGEHYAKGGEKEKARAQLDMAYMLEHNRPAATRAVQALQSAVAPVHVPKGPAGPAPSGR